MASSAFVPARLARVRRTLEAYVDRGDVPGLVAFARCGEERHLVTIGNASFAPSAPMADDTIFRIASLSKLVTAVAAMILIEECRLRLDEPVDRWLPELADRRVLREISSPLEDTVPAERPISVRDLMTSCMGFGSVMARPGTYPIQTPMRDLRIGGDGPMVPTDMPAPDEWLRRLGSLPWMAQPGARWSYHVSMDVLGVLIGRVAGTSFGAFLRERIFGPLGMDDTSFRLAPDAAGRMSTVYASGDEPGTLREFDGAEGGAWSATAPFESGGGGLLSTVRDFAAFSTMLLRGGRADRERVLSAASVALMTSDRLTPAQRKGTEIFFGTFSSWGFGMAVDTHPEEIYQVPGRFGWVGAFGTTAYVDPRNDAVGILFTQRSMDTPEPSTVFADFWTSLYAALDR